MSIYAGQTQIKKIYAGSTQIKKAYKGSVLIYQSENIIYPPQALTTWTDMGNVGSVSVAKVTCNTNDDNMNSKQRGFVLDVTNLHALTITCDMSAIGYGAHAGIVLHTSRNYMYYSVGGHGTSYTRKKNVGNNSFSGDTVFDVSTLTGNYFLYWGCYNEYGVCNSNVNITKITAE